MPEGVWTNLSRDAGAACCFSHGPPDHLVGDRCVHTALAGGAWKQINRRLLPTPMLAHGFEQFRTERDIPVTRAFTLPDMDHHAFAVDVGHFSSESSVRRIPVP